MPPRATHSGCTAGCRRSCCGSEGRSYIGVVRFSGTVVALALAIAAVCAVLGIVYALIRSSSYVESIAFALAVGGATVCLVAAMAGSPGQRAAQSRVVVGGRFVEGSDRPQPESSFVLIPASLMVLGMGVVLYILAI
jgi:hypothetical protein